MADKPSWTKPHPHMTYGDSIAMAERRERRGRGAWEARGEPGTTDAGGEDRLGGPALCMLAVADGAEVEVRTVHSGALTASTRGAPAESG